MDGNTVNNVGFLTRLKSADISSEQAQCVRFNCRKPEPSDLFADGEYTCRREQLYGLLWEWKRFLRKKDYGRICFPISEDDAISFLKEKGLLRRVVNNVYRLLPFIGMVNYVVCCRNAAKFFRVIIHIQESRPMPRWCVYFNY